MRSEKLLSRKWKALSFLAFLSPLCACQSIRPPSDSAWIPTAEVGSVCVKVKNLKRWGFLGHSVPEHSTLLSTPVRHLEFRLSLQRLFLLGSHHRLGTKTVVETCCGRWNQAPFFFLGGLDSVPCSLRTLSRVLLAFGKTRLNTYVCISSLLWSCAHALSPSGVFFLLCFVGLCEADIWRGCLPASLFLILHQGTHWIFLWKCLMTN